MLHNIKTWQYVVIGLLVTLIALLIIADNWLTPYDLARERAEARAAGLPLEPADLARVKPPASQDAAPDWRSLADILEKRPLDESAVPDMGGLLPDSAMPEVRQLLNERRDVLDLVHRATDKPHAYFAHAWNPSEPLQYFVPTRRAARILRWEGMSLFRQGRVEEAVTAQARGLRIAQHLGEDPLLIAHLVSLAIEAIALAGFEDMLMEAGPDARLAGLIRQALTDHPTTRDLRRAMKGEVVYGVQGMRNVRTLSDARSLIGLFPAPGAGKPGLLDPFVVRYVSEQGEAAFLKGMVRLDAARRLPTYPERRRATDQVSREIGTVRTLSPPADRMAAMSIPVFSKAEDRDISVLARRRVLLAACDVMAFRARTGAWPASLSAAGAVQEDPFTEKPLGYRREGKGFVVYSVGMEGKYAAKPGQPDKGQAVFRYP